MSVYFNIRNTLPKSGTFLLGHPVYIYIYIFFFTMLQEQFEQYNQISWGNETRDE